MLNSKLLKNHLQFSFYSLSSILRMYTTICSLKILIFLMLRSHFKEAEFCAPLLCDSTSWVSRLKVLPFFCMWITSFPNTICSMCTIQHHFPMYILGSLVEYQLTVYTWVYFWALLSRSIDSSTHLGILKIGKIWSVITKLYFA